MIEASGRTIDVVSAFTGFFMGCCRVRRTGAPRPAGRLAPRRRTAAAADERERARARRPVQHAATVAARGSSGSAGRCRPRSSPTSTSRRASTRPTPGSGSGPASSNGASPSPASDHRRPGGGGRRGGPARIRRRSGRRGRRASSPPPPPTPRARPPRRRCRPRLGTAGAAFDLNAACAGFAYALYVGIGMLAAGSVDHVLVIGADRFTALVDPDDRATAILFGDGAGAVLLGRAEPGRIRARPGLLGADLGGDGNALTALHVPPGRAVRARWTARRCSAGPRAPWCRRARRRSTPPAPVPGRRRPVRAAPGQRSASSRPPPAGSHIPAERVVVDVDRYGNTSAASVPIALAEADGGRAADRRHPGAAVRRRCRHGLGQPLRAVGHVTRGRRPHASRS